MNHSKHTPHIQFKVKQKKAVFKTILFFVWNMITGLLIFIGFVTLIIFAAFLGITSNYPEFVDSPPRPIQHKPKPIFSLPNLDSLDLQPERHVIYLNREGGTLTAGADDSRRNISSVVANAGLSEAKVDGFNANPARWNSIVTCVRNQFKDFNVEIVDQRPISVSYVMVMVGGKPEKLATSAGQQRRNARLTGLAPQGSQPIHNAIAYAFARQMYNNSRNVCETIAHEVGHVYGLDHVMDARDPMSYLPKSGRRTFQKRSASCGEFESRFCDNGQPYQSSYQQLLQVLGSTTRP